jgi:hypothetical protein
MDTDSHRTILSLGTWQTHRIRLPSFLRLRTLIPKRKNDLKYSVGRIVNTVEQETAGIPCDAQLRGGASFAQRARAVRGIMETSPMIHTQPGDPKVDEARLAALCQEYRVRELSLFGSAARGEMRGDSDIDLLVEFLPHANIGLVEHAGLMLDLTRLLGRKVDLVSKNGLKPRIRESILADARVFYAA